MTVIRAVNDYGAVNTGTSPKVQYTWSFAPSGSANHSRLTSITYPNGRVIDHEYSTGLNDTISRLSAIKDGSTTLESYEYFGSATVVKRARPQPGVDLTFIKQTGESDADVGDKYIGLDRFGRIADNRWRSSSADLERRKYGHDRNSNRLYAENTVNTARSELYAYDGLNQLTSMDRGTLNGTKDGISGSPSRSQDWDYDGLGNWDSLTTDGGSPQTRGHNKQNEITSISGASTPTYDANGNLLTDETGKQFVYDAWNRLVTVKSSGGSTLATYRYDGIGRRVRETRGGTTTDLYYSAEWQVLEERVSGNAVKSYVWSPVYVDAMISRDRDTDGNGSLDERLYAIHDANFNIIALIDTSGAVVERFAYDAFGVFSVLTPAWGSRGSSNYGWVYLHQGGRWDADGGVYSFRHREYSPTLGRWLQEDPLGCIGNTFNLFVGYDNNPLVSLDYLGLRPAVVPGVPSHPNLPDCPAALADVGTGHKKLVEMVLGKIVFQLWCSNASKYGDYYGLIQLASGEAWRFGRCLFEFGQNLFMFGIDREGEDIKALNFLIWINLQRPSPDAPEKQKKAYESFMKCYEGVKEKILEANKEGKPLSLEQVLAAIDKCATENPDAFPHDNLLQNVGTQQPRRFLYYVWKPDDRFINRLFVDTRSGKCSCERDKQTVGFEPVKK